MKEWVAYYGKDGATQTAPLVYFEKDAMFMVNEGGNKTKYPLEKLQKIRYQHWQDDDQTELIEV